jgi:hypothetical protein
VAAEPIQTDTSAHHEVAEANAVTEVTNPRLRDSVPKFLGRPTDAGQLGLEHRCRMSSVPRPGWRRDHDAPTLDAHVADAESSQFRHAQARQPRHDHNVAPLCGYQAGQILSAAAMLRLPDMSSAMIAKINHTTLRQVGVAQRRDASARPP